MVTTPCWVWPGAHNTFGYGTFSMDGKIRLAHRVVYEATMGPATNLHLHHLCGTRDCVNPWHLERLTGSDHAKITNGPRVGRSKTHCIHGHAYTVENTYFDKRGMRHCRECGREVSRRLRAQKTR